MYLEGIYRVHKYGCMHFRDACKTKSILHHIQDQQEWLNGECDHEALASLSDPDSNNYSTLHKVNQLYKH